jgi:hypothetical protein
MEYQDATSGVEPESYEKSFFQDDDDGGCSARMDVLEEELHAELEQLKATYGSETPPFMHEEEEEEHYSEVPLVGSLILCWFLILGRF